jgi:nucleoside-diphosphate-sugar epimerase
MPQSIFVTGAGGFIGQSLIQPRSGLTNCSIKVLTRRPLPECAPKSNLPVQVVGDLLDPGTYRAALMGCDTVVHLAAVTGRAARTEYERVNVEGTRALLHTCKAVGVRRFLHMSTIAAGYPDQRYYPYAKTKARAEALVRESGLDFAIIRPTLVLGVNSPIWNTLLKIAKLPMVPLPEGARPVLVQPVRANDVVRGMELLLESGRFEGEVLELGGPRPLPFREFLGLIQRALHGEPGRVVRVPLGPIRTLLALTEQAMRPLLPVTAGQLAVFANDSVPSENWLLAQLRADMPSMEETIAALVDAGNGGDGSRMGMPRWKRQERPMSENAKRVLEAECRSFAAYLVGAAPISYIEEQYTKAAHAHGLGFDEEFPGFDRVTLALARRGRMLARWADAYCSIFHRGGPLRRKLIVLAAILEHVAPTNEVFDRVQSRHVALTVLSLAAYGWTSAVSLLLGAVILLPVRLLCWIATRSKVSSIPAR